MISEFWCIKRTIKWPESKKSWHSCSGWVMVLVRDLYKHAIHLLISFDRIFNFQFPIYYFHWSRSILVGAWLIQACTFALATDQLWKNLQYQLQSSTSIFNFYWSRSILAGARLIQACKHSLQSRISFERILNQSLNQSITLQRNIHNFWIRITLNHDPWVHINIMGDLHSQMSEPCWKVVELTD